MNNLYCNIETCDYRSKRRSQSKNRKGEYLYKCTKENIVIVPFCPGDSVDYGENTVTCLGYREKSKEFEAKPKTKDSKDKLIQEALKIAKRTLERHNKVKENSIL